MNIRAYSLPCSRLSFTKFDLHQAIFRVCEHPWFMLICKTHVAIGVTIFESYWLWLFQNFLLFFFKWFSIKMSIFFRMVNPLRSKGGYSIFCSRFNLALEHRELNKVYFHKPLKYDLLWFIILIASNSNPSFSASECVRVWRLDSSWLYFNDARANFLLMKLDWFMALCLATKWHTSERHNHLVLSQLFLTFLLPLSLLKVKVSYLLSKYLLTEGCVLAPESFKVLIDGHL